LTAAALRQDRRDPQVAAARRESARASARARELAERGIPPEGASYMVANDPPERGRRLFAQHCTQCHTIGGGREYKAPDLAGLFSLEWVKEQIRDPNQPHRFGSTKLARKMDAFGRRLAPDRIDALARFIHARRDPERADADPSLEEGRRLFRRIECDECHSLNPGEAKDAPNLYEYASDRYLRLLLEDPGSRLYFGRKRNDMPAMRTRLTSSEIAAVMAYLRTLEALPVHGGEQAMR
jgi:mono/diheme cytochrome c family protein